MEERININVSATDYEKSSNGIRSILTRLEEMVHEENCFVITDSEFAFGWHFYIVSVNKMLVDKLADQIGERFQKLKGKGLEKKVPNLVFTANSRKKPKGKIGNQRRDGI